MKVTLGNRASQRTHDDRELSGRQLCAREPIQADALLRRLHGQGAVHLGRDAHTELAAVVLFCHGLGHGLTAGLHVGHDVGHDFTNTF